LILTNTVMDDTFLKNWWTLAWSNPSARAWNLCPQGALPNYCNPSFLRKICRAVLSKLLISLISNTVQQVVGYRSYTREFCQYISPASIHALPLTAASIFDIMCSSSRSGGYAITNRQGGPITSYAWATHNKDAIFGSFQDLEKIKQICSDHHLRFDHRIILLPKWHWPNPRILAGYCKICHLPSQRKKEG
jgi:hypothetical protein